jgi:hypothetical protein
MIFSIGIILILCGLIYAKIWGTQNYETGWNGVRYYSNSNIHDHLGAFTFAVGLFFIGYSVLKFVWNTFP